MRGLSFSFLLLLWVTLPGCAQPNTPDLPEFFDFEAKPILPVRIWTEWIKEKPNAPRVPGLLAGNIFEATVKVVHLDGVSPRKALSFTLKPEFHDEIYVRLQLPAPAEAWIPFERGDNVIVQVVDAPSQGKTKPRINLSIVRATDGSAIHVLEGQSTLPEPFPEALSLVPQLMHVGQVAEGDRRFCARVYERHPMELRRDGFDPVKMLPGHPIEFRLGTEVDGWVEVRDCLSTAEGTCPSIENGQWVCQALIGLRPRENQETR